MIHHLQKLTATGEQLYAKVCTVHRVDKENKCCDVAPVDGTAELFDIPFQADVEGTGLCFYPAENSKVLVVFINKHHACICNVSEVDLMKLAIDKMEFSVDKDKFLLKNEELEFLIDKDSFNLKKEDVQVSIDKEGLNLKNKEVDFLIDKEGLNLKKDDVKFLVDKSGLNLKKGEVKFSIDQAGLNLEKGGVKFLVDENGLNFKKGGVAFSIDKSGILLKTESESLKKLMTDLMKAILNMKFMTSQGPTTLLMTAAEFTAIQTRLNTFLKD